MIADIRQLLDSYPRQRPPLPAAQRDRYVEEYRLNRMGNSGIFAGVRLLESWMHRKVAAAPGGPRVLEVGAGTLNHVRYEPTTTHYDVIEPFRELYQGSPYHDRIGRFYEDLYDVPSEPAYDRILSVAVLEHLAELPWIVARSSLLLTPGGHFLAAIPSEGHFLWEVGWRLTTGIAYRLRTGLDYGAIMRHEHINTAEEVVAVTRYFFATVRLSRFPMGCAPLSFYTAITADTPRRDVAAAFLSERPYVRTPPPHVA